LFDQKKARANSVKLFFWMEKAGQKFWSSSSLGCEPAFPYYHHKLFKNFVKITLVLFGFLSLHGSLLLYGFLLFVGSLSLFGSLFTMWLAFTFWVSDYF